MGVDDISLEDVRDILDKRAFTTQAPTRISNRCCWSKCSLQPEYSTPTHICIGGVSSCDYADDLVDHKLGLVLPELSNRSESQVCGLRTLNITLQKSAQIVLNHCKVHQF